MHSVRREYTLVSNEKRAELIALLNNNNNIRSAAEQVGIKYENAKAIYRTYRLQNRVRKANREMNLVGPVDAGKPAVIRPAAQSSVLMAFDREAAMLAALIDAKTPLTLKQSANASKCLQNAADATDETDFAFWPTAEASGQETESQACRSCDLPL